MSLQNHTDTPFFKSTPTIIKPYAFMDLDDTLFQTQRKIDGWDLPTANKDRLVCASVNKKNEPLSMMTVRQQAFFNWLRLSTELIVVTARDRQEIKRVKLPFNSWQVLTHGAVILHGSGESLTAWQQKMGTVLTPLQDKLYKLVDVIEDYNQTQGGDLKLALHHDEFIEPEQAVNSVKTLNQPLYVPDHTLSEMLIYIAVKHRKKDHQALQDFGNWLLAVYPELKSDFYIHSNANNLAILPHGIHKRHAVAFLLEHHLDDMRPSFGFGDSLADLPFLQLLDWYGTPNHGQVHDHIRSL